MNNFSVEKFKYLTQKKFNSIDGIPASEVVEITKSYIEELINDNGFDAGIVDIAIYGSRSRGLETPDSDIDVVFEYNGSEREDDLFNLLHSEELYIGNVPVDTNPIRKEESGSLSEYLQRADVYLRKIDRTLKGGNRDFASYESFQYEQKDLDEKCRVLKDGCFLVEFLPEENAENYKYIFQIKEMAEKAGLEYFTTVPWKKGDFVANTGRKSKNTEQVVMFTKGKARNLRLDMKKIGKDIEKPAVITYKNYTSDITASSNDEPKDYQNYEDGMAVEIKLIVTTKDKDRALKELDKAWDNWWSSEYESLPLYSSNNTFDIYDLPIGEYMLEWLKKMNVKYLDIDSQEFRQEDYFMSGASGMLPTVFDVEPVSKNEKIHQAEKPVELLEQIINFVTQPNEKILDQFAGSGVVGEAALNTKRDSVLIEKDEDTFKRMCERLNKRDAETKSMEKAKKI